MIDDYCLDISQEASDILSSYPDSSFSCLKIVLDNCHLFKQLIVKLCHVSLSSNIDSCSP